MGLKIDHAEEKRGSSLLCLEVCGIKVASKKLLSGPNALVAVSRGRNKRVLSSDGTSQLSTRCLSVSHGNVFLYMRSSWYSALLMMSHTQPRGEAKRAAFTLGGGLIQPNCCCLSTVRLRSGGEKHVGTSCA